MLYPEVSHSCSARFPWQIYQTSDVRASKHLKRGNSAKGRGSFCFNGTRESLATCSFLKSHYLPTWSGVRCTVDSENIIPTLLNKSYKQGARRWETPTKLCTTFPTSHWHLIHIGDCLRRKCCWPELVKTSMVLTHKLDYQERGTRMDAQPCSWPFPHQATWLLYFYFDAPPLQRRFKRILLECLAFNTHERGQKPPGLPLRSRSSPTQSGWPFAQSRFRFSQEASQVANLFILNAHRFTIKQHRISAILDLARRHNLRTFAAHFLSEPVEDSGIDGRLCPAHPFL